MNVYTVGLYRDGYADVSRSPGQNVRTETSAGRTFYNPGNENVQF